MKCKKCKKEISDESIYCMWCGSAQKKDKKKKMYQRPDGLFEKIIVLDGKRVPFRGKTESDVYKKIANYEEKQEAGRTLYEVATEWEKKHFPTLSPTTQRGYKAAYERTLEWFGEFPIKEISPKIVSSKISEFAQKGYSQKTVTNQILILRLIFDYAGTLNEIQSNPMEFIKTPRGLPKNPRELPLQDDIGKVQSGVNLPFGFFPYFVLYTGCRRGEALAMQYKDIDFAKKTISISKSVFFATNHPDIKEPKTRAGNRDVPLLDVLAEVFPMGKPNDYVFQENGKLLTECQFMHRWKKYQKLSGVLCSAHQLRHAYATLLYEAGVDRKDAQGLMGHADIATTDNIYTHLSDTQKQRTAEKLNAFTKNTQYTTKTPL